MDEIIELIKTYRLHLHTIPEIAYKEIVTREWIYDTLRVMGMDDLCYYSGGIIGIIKSTVNSNRKHIGIRAEMDALNIQEVDDKQCRSHISTNPGKMHACGHDGHMAIVLGVAKYFSINKDKFEGSIYFLFTPAEECGAGCEKMVKNGLFRKFPIREVYAVHNWPDLDLGKIAISDHTIMCGDSEIFVTIRGKGGHAAIPENVINPIKYINIVTNFIEKITLNSDIVMTPTQIKGFSDINVVPTEIVISYSLRYPTKEARNIIYDKLDNINDIKINGIKFCVECKEGYIPTINDKTCAGWCKDVVKNMDIAEYVQTEASKCSEDFGYLLEKIPGCYVFLGVKDDCHTVSLHSNTFDFNDKSLKIGLEYFVNLLIYRMQPKIKMGFIQVPTDIVLQDEIHDLLSQLDYIDFECKKMESEKQLKIEKDSLMKLTDSLKNTSRDFIKSDCDIISLCCTSLSFIIGSDTIKNTMKTTPINTNTTKTINDMASALVSAIKTVSTCKPIYLLTPYVDEVHQEMVKFLTNNDIYVEISKNLGINDDYKVSEMTPNDIKSIVNQVINRTNDSDNECEVFVISCSAMRCTGLGFIDELEKEHPKTTFITSNQATLWKALHMTHNDTNRSNIKNIKGYGKLFNF